MSRKSPKACDKKDAEALLLRTSAPEENNYSTSFYRFRWLVQLLSF